MANYTEFLNQNYLNMVQGCLANILSWESYFILIDTLLKDLNVLL